MNNMKVLIKILLVFSCIDCSNLNAEKMEYATNLLEAKVLRITERFQVMIASEGSHDESKKLITDSVYGYIEQQIIYDENGKATITYSGAALGLVAHSIRRQEDFLPDNTTVKGFIVRWLDPERWAGTYFEEEDYKYECKIDRNKNYIIDTAYPRPRRGEWGPIDFVTDTIKDFVIIPKNRIILSKDDYKLLQKAKDGYAMSGERYILYRYEEDNLKMIAYKYLLKPPIDCVRKIREYTAQVLLDLWYSYLLY